MSREIKFRAWDIEQNCFVYSNSTPVIELTIQNVITRPRLDKVGKVAWMQYTGLKDKNGKEIYEGDVLAIPLYGQGCVIVWNENICAFQYAYHAVGRGTSINGRMTNTLYEMDSSKYEVIGNIYEHAHLLNKKVDAMNIDQESNFLT